MNSGDFNSTLQWVISHGYVLMFFAMILEGPLITAAAAFAVALGYFNLPAIFALSILGDVVADVVYFEIGHFGRLAFVEKYGAKFGLSKERMKRLERHLLEHGGKTIAAIKLNPITPIPGLMLVGASGMKLKRFASISALITIPKVILFMLLGYYFGKAYDSLAQYFHYGTYVFIVILILAIILFFGYRKISAFIADKIEKI